MVEKLKFFYEKTSDFRVVHVDGAIGGPTPSRLIFLSLYNQRNPIPKVIEQELFPDGTLGKETVAETRVGVYRQMEVGLMMTAQVADELGVFLLAQARILRETELKPPAGEIESRTK